MEFLWKQIHIQNIGFWVYTFCAVNLIGVTIWTYIKRRTIWPSILRYAFLKFSFLGFFPFLTLGWIVMLTSYHTDIFTVIILYFIGFTSILHRQYVLTFLQEIPKLPEYPTQKKQLKFMRKFTKHTIYYYLITGYFFSMGTILLYFILTD